MNYCLTKKEINDLQEHLENGREIEDASFLSYVELAKSWECQLACLNYFFAQTLDKKRKNGVANLEQIVNRFYRLSDDHYIDMFVQEFDIDFVDFLMHSNSGDSSLDEKLRDIQSRLSDYNYREIFHFTRI